MYCRVCPAKALWSVWGHGALRVLLKCRGDDERGDDSDDSYDDSEVSEEWRRGTCDNFETLALCESCGSLNVTVKPHLVWKPRGNPR